MGIEAVIQEVIKNTKQKTRLSAGVCVHSSFCFSKILILITHLFTGLTQECCVQAVGCSDFNVCHWLLFIGHPPEDPPIGGQRCVTYNRIFETTVSLLQLIGASSRMLQLQSVCCDPHTVAELHTDVEQMIAAYEALQDASQV